MHGLVYGERTPNLDAELVVGLRSVSISDVDRNVDMEVINSTLIVLILEARQSRISCVSNIFEVHTLQVLNLDEVCNSTRVEVEVNIVTICVSNVGVHFLITALEGDTVVLPISYLSVSDGLDSGLLEGVVILLVQDDQILLVRHVGGCHGQVHKHGVHRVAFQLGEAHQEALDALAAWCAEDSFVSYVEIGSVGQNGDWSATAESAADLIPSGQVLEQYRQQYEEAFSGDEDILLFFSDTGSRLEALVYEAEEHLYFGDAAATAENLSRTGAVWEKAPVGGGMTDTIPMDTLLMDNLSDTLDQIRSSHLSYIGPVCPDAEQQQSNGSEMILRNVGYCLYLSRLQTTVDFLDDTLQIHFTFNNIGAAPMYRDWPVRMYIFNKKKCICEQTLDLRLSDLLPDKEITVTGSVPYSRDLLNGFSVGIAITSPDGSEFITLAQKGVLPDGKGIHKVYRHKKKH